MVRPLFGNVLVRPITQEETAGLVLTDETNPQRGEIVAVGTGSFSNQLMPIAPGAVPSFIMYPMLVEVGQKVFFKKTAPREEILSDGQKMYLMDQQDIIAIIEDKNDGKN